MPDRLPYDYSRCPGACCDVRELCTRHTAKCPEPASMVDLSLFGPAVTRTETCSGFISNVKQGAPA